MTMYAMLKPRMSEHEQRFELLADLGAMIAGEVELDDLLATFATRVARALGADRATLWLIDGATDEIRSRVATLPELSELRVPQGYGVVGHVAKTGELVNIRDVPSDPRWSQEIAQEKVGHVTYDDAMNKGFDSAEKTLAARIQAALEAQR